MAVLSRRSISRGHDCTAHPFHQCPFSVSRSKFTGTLGAKEKKDRFFLHCLSSQGPAESSFLTAITALWPFWHRDVLSDEAWSLDSPACPWKNKNMSEDTLSERLGAAPNQTKIIEDRLTKAPTTRIVILLARHTISHHHPLCLN